ncbi:MAG: phosphate ABC transporter permease subunit PstC [Candidatus Methanoperedens sp.]|nr:phosphate ABC transporter permease subunit PstC [Candidatus Methanoperedens sp.]CAG0964111.1 Phosphate transport system permease protein PstC 1 [Methanosarcinales archaeon]
MFSRKIKDLVAGRFMQAAAILSCILVLVIAITLFIRSWPILEVKSLGDLLLGSTWMPFQGEFGFFPFIIGTLYVTLIAMVIAVPLSILSAVYLAEYANENLRTKVLPVIDLLAGIPPVVYGVWGVLAVVPIVAYIAPLVSPLGIPFLNTNGYSTGYSLLAGGIVLAIMVFPIIISISEQVLRAVPSDIREASLSLGATRWQTIKNAVIRIAYPGIAAAVILGFSRAIGETMAVLMVVGNVPNIPSSVFDSAYPLTALIANNYGEMMSIPLYDSALLLAALILMLVILFFTLAARLILIRIERRMANG